MLTRLAIFAAILIVLAWKDRKNKLILFGVASVLCLLGVLVPMSRFPVLAPYLMMTSFFLAVICLGIAAKRFFSFLRQKAKRETPMSRIRILAEAVANKIAAGESALAFGGRSFSSDI